MKIRTGFVSNSSSASFIVKINLDKETLINTLLSDFWYVTENYLESRIKDLADLRDKLTKGNNGYFKDELENEIKRTENDIASISKCTSNNERLEHYFHFHGVDIQEGLSNWVEISSWIIMFNDYSDVPSALQQIILYFLFDRPEVKMICDVRND